MSIERTNPLIPITAISQRNLNEGAQEARKPVIRKQKQWRVILL